MGNPTAPEEITRLLQEWRDGDQDALNRLIPLVYDQLRKLARSARWGERPDHTLQTTALVHEAYERMVEMEVSWRDRAHFFHLASRVMRRVLVDHAKARRRQKRGSGRRDLPLDQAVEVAADSWSDLLDLNRALEQLEEMAPRQGRVMEMVLFGGMTYDETAQALEVSPATIKRELRSARAWLRRELRGGRR